MGLRILYDTGQDMAAMYDSVTDTAFGPVFYAGEHHEPAEERIQKFIDWLPADARVYNARDLENFYAMWLDAGEPGGQDEEDEA